MVILDRSASECWENLITERGKQIGIHKNCLEDSCTTVEGAVVTNENREDDKAKTTNHFINDIHNFDII